MTTITTDADNFTVIATLDVDPAHQDELVGIMEDTAALFARQPGFIALALHRSLDGGKVLTYLQWRSKADHEACQRSEDMMKHGGAFMAFLQSGKATFQTLELEVVKTL